MNTKFYAIFILFLVITLPIYSASAFAANIRVTKNSGSAGINGFLNGESDTWTVETLVTNIAEGEEVTAEKVFMQISDNKEAFSTCEDGPNGKNCKYISSLKDGIKSGEYLFKVIIENTGAAESGSIKVDGVAPEISGFSILQNNDGKVSAKFNVIDPNSPSVGLKEIQIIDAETKKVIHTINEFDSNSYQFNELLPDVFTGIGTKRVKVQATDKLGHIGYSPVASFQGDFIAPVIQNLSFTQFGKFIGEYKSSSDILVDIIDTEFPTISTTSEQAEISGKTPTCIADEDKDQYWHCKWSNIQVTPAQTISIKFIAKDNSGNTAEKTLSKTFVVDKSVPKVKSFTTLRTYQDTNYIKKGQNTFIGVIEKSGAGISQDGIVANMLGFGKSAQTSPDSCELKDEGYTCIWNVNFDGASSSVSTGISYLIDNVGNTGDTPEVKAVYDNINPEILNIAVFGGEEKRAGIRSQDNLVIELNIEEKSGLTILTNLNDLVNDAETKFPTNLYNDESGWLVSTEKSCEKKEDIWTCSIKTPAIRSGPESNVEFEILVMDTAGNIATWGNVQTPPTLKLRNSPGKYSLDILGVSDEKDPDYWEVGSINPMTEFIDLDTTHLTKTRAAFDINLHTKSSRVSALDMKLGNCVADNESGPKVSRAIMFGESTDNENPNPKIIVEFEKFNGKEKFKIAPPEGEEKTFDKETVQLTCNLLISSRVGQDALTSPEIQQIPIEVNFGYTELGAIDANVEHLIKKERESLKGFWEVIGTMNTVLKWIDYVYQGINMLVGGWQLFTMASSAFDATKAYPPLEAGRIAGCFGINAGGIGLDKMSSWVTIPMQILTCRPIKGSDGGNWYSKWHETILSLYNLEVALLIDERKVGTEAKSVRLGRDIKDNMFLSVVGLCVPGMIKALENFRQITCRKIYCYENEVAQGVATVSRCNELASLLTCKYVLGELWYVIPFSKLWDDVMGLFSDLLKNPLALANAAVILACAPSCLATNSLHAACKVSYWLFDFLNRVSQIIGFVQTIVGEFQGGADYCGMIMKEETKTNSTTAQNPPTQTPPAAGSKELATINTKK